MLLSVNPSLHQDLCRIKYQIKGVPSWLLCFGNASLWWKKCFMCIRIISTANSEVLWSMHAHHIHITPLCSESARILWAVAVWQIGVVKWKHRHNLKKHFIVALAHGETVLNVKNLYFRKIQGTHNISKLGLCIVVLLLEVLWLKQRYKRVYEFMTNEIKPTFLSKLAMSSDRSFSWLFNSSSMVLRGTCINLHRPPLVRLTLMTIKGL